MTLQIWGSLTMMEIYTVIFSGIFEAYSSPREITSYIQWNVGGAVLQNADFVPFTSQFSKQTIYPHSA